MVPHNKHAPREVEKTSKVYKDMQRERSSMLQIISDSLIRYVLSTPMERGHKSAPSMPQEFVANKIDITSDN